MATNPLWEPTLSYSEADLRSMDSMLAMSDGTAFGSRPGVRPGDLGLTVTLSGSTINVSAGVACLYRSGQGLYRAYLGATSPGTVAAANATYTRIDLVYLRVWDTAVDATGLRKTDAVYLQGTASATPVAPSPGATEIYIPLATITVPASGGGSPTVSTAVRPYTVAPGGILPVTSTSEPGSGGPGQVFYDADTDTFKYFTAAGAKAVLLNSSGASPIGKFLPPVYKTADTQRQNTTALAADPHLVLPVAANAVYALDGYLDYDGAFGAGGLQCDWTAPAGTTMRWTLLGNVGGDTTQKYTSNSTLIGAPLQAGTYGTGGQHNAANPHGYISTGSTAGNITLTWAQGSVSATFTTIYTGSWIRLQRIA